MAACLEAEWERGRDRLSASLQGQLERGRAITALAYQRALARLPRIAQGFGELFANFDALLTPAVAGTAPAAETTGDPCFGTLWTLAGMPALSLPLLSGLDGLPLGVQLVGAKGTDARLLRTARWLTQRVQAL